ncbi:palmitoyltransferase for Vac8p [Onygenales sp. PD_40]|nr:palmitoyltransferase for Vac8p [Onygenales sp. PD_40]KAK2781244.1 palmitoyltransferase for Vac8p [Onygenales sp. PD_12]
MEAFSAAPPESSPISPTKRRCRNIARTSERLCCSAVRYFPLAFVYGLTTWAVYVEVQIGMQPTKTRWIGSGTSALGVLLYVLLNASYTIAVFTDPGSPSGGPQQNTRNSRHEYTYLPTTETAEYTSLTVNSTGGKRYCKKCQCVKPDRAHHCSSCKRCVLKMDHHCPWLATCVGFRNYKAFLLFLIYTCLFCWACFAVSGTWVWVEMLNETEIIESLVPVNNVLLAIISGVIGLVLSGFTAWHISLAVRGLTTIECLEKTRYLSPLRRSLDRQRQERYGPTHWSTDNRLGQTLHGYGQQILDAHANAIPGVTRAEEGEERTSPTVQNRRLDSEHGFQHHPGANPTHQLSPAQQSLYRSYEELEQQRERERYDEYLDEQDGEKLPNAFDLGWRRNLKHLFGPQPLLWPLPICTTTGDGWHWEASLKWLEVKQRIENRRRQRLREYQSQHHQPQQTPPPPQQQYYEHHAPINSPSRGGYSNGSLSHGSTFAASNDSDRPSTGVSMKTLRPVSRPGETEPDSELGSGPLENGTASGSLDSPAPGRPGKGRDDEWRDWD